MKFLLDTHVLLWWLAGNERLRPADRAMIEDQANMLLVSVVSLWEIVIKIRIGKLDVEMAYVESAIARLGFHKVWISPDHVAKIVGLPTAHRDPFDHMLIAQALVEDATLISADAIMTRYPVRLMQV